MLTNKHQDKINKYPLYKIELFARRLLKLI